MNIGIIGSGQLAKMLIEESKKIKEQSFNFFLWDCSKNCAANLADHFFHAPFDCQDTFDQFAQRVDLFTYEFEHINLSLIERLNNIKPVYPSVKALKFTQNRLLEKQFCNSLYLKTTDYQELKTDSRYVNLVQKLKSPILIKSITEGYDGKHQYRIKSENDWQSFIQKIGQESMGNFIAEKWIDFEYETSIIATRSQSGEIVFFDLAINEHTAGILYKSVVSLNHPLKPKAEEIARKILLSFDYVGTLAIEFFVKDDELIINEIAPRVHNTGHWTIEGALTSQFENHIRAISGLALVKSQTIGYPAMINLIGKIPISEKELPQGAFLHQYGKKPRKGRKVGHITLSADSEIFCNNLINQIHRKINFL